MFNPQPLDVLFLTNFSDYCFRTIPAIAQMAGALKIRLTLMHVYDPAHCSQAKAEAQLHSFFPEADRYAACHRVAVAGTIHEAVQRHLQVWPVNLIVAPASDEIGLPRIGRRGKRARLIRENGVPVWTIGRRVQLQRLAQPVRNVACWLDFYSARSGHLEFAMEYAHKLNAKLHLLRALPDINEGSLSLGSQPDKALHPERATKEIMRLCANAAIRPEVHVSYGTGRSAVARMLRDCDADVAFLGDEQASFREWLGLGLRLGDGIPCSAIYVSEHNSVPVWNLETSLANRTRSQIRLATNQNNELPVAAAHHGNRTVVASWASQLGLL